MKAYKIKTDIVAAHSEQQAVSTWAEHFDEDPKAAGPCEEINPDTFPVSYEQEDGSFKDGMLADSMPDKEPMVVIDGDADC
jgi:hypothetical protein